MGIKAYKGFNKDMTCRGFQFEEGKTYHEDEAELCKKGFHACLDLLDCFNYYNPAESVYHEVELGELSIEKSSEDSKVCGKSIKIGKKIGADEIYRESTNFISREIKNINVGNNSKIGAGNYSKIGVGNNSKIGAGNYSIIGAGNDSIIGAGNDSIIGAGTNSVLAAFNSKAKAGLNSLIVLANREWDGNEYVITDFAAAIVDGKTIKPDTWYILKGGKFVEAETDES